MLLAIDPGTTHSAYLFMGGDGSIRDFGFEDNDTVRNIVAAREYHELVIEEIRSYGMSLGRSTFEAIKWTGRFWEVAYTRCLPVQWVGRKDVTNYLIEGGRGGDAALKDALQDKFGKLKIATRKSPEGHNEHTLAALGVALYWHAALKANLL